MNKPLPRNPIAPEGFPQDFFDKLNSGVQDLTRFTLSRLDPDCRERAIEAAKEGDIQKFYEVMMDLCSVMEKRLGEKSPNPKTLN